MIFQGDADSPPADQCMGWDIMVTPKKDANGNRVLDECDQGQCKYFHGGPTCHFCGKDIPAMFFILPSGGITADILVKILKNLDEQNVFDHKKDRCTPMIILDGHKIQLKYTFLHYINEQSTNWKMVLDTPYGTSYWQVADSLEQNGC